MCLDVRAGVMNDRTVRLGEKSILRAARVEAGDTPETEWFPHGVRLDCFSIRLGRK